MYQSHKVKTKVKRANIVSRGKRGEVVVVENNIRDWPRGQSWTVYMVSLILSPSSIPSDRNIKGNKLSA